MAARGVPRHYRDALLGAAENLAAQLAGGGGADPDLADDDLSATSSSIGSTSTSKQFVRLPSAVQYAAAHVEQHDLLPVLQTSVVSGEGIRDVLSAVREVARHPLIAVPSSQRHLQGGAVERY